jgi:hypothetical protein
VGQHALLVPAAARRLVSEPADDNPWVVRSFLPEPERTMHPYRLAPDVYACVTRAGVVLLDLSNDAYFGLSLEQAHALTSVIRDCPYVPSSECAAITAPHALIEWLQGRGLIELCTESNIPRESPDLPCEALQSMEGTPPSSVRFHHVVAFVRALAAALFYLKARCLIATVRRCRKRQSRPRQASASDEALSELTAAYAQLRVLFFTRQGRCLLDSVTLIEFLAAYGHFPRLVIGVHQEPPFSAHSWVQQDRWILNGTAGFVGSYVPILIV